MAAEIGNMLGLGDATLDSLNAKLISLDDAFVLKMKTIADALVTLKGKAIKANESVKTKIESMTSTLEKDKTALEEKLASMKSGSEQEKKQITEKVTKLSATIDKITTTLSSNTASETTITALDGIIDEIQKQLAINSDNTAAQSSSPSPSPEVRAAAPRSYADVAKGVRGGYISQRRSRRGRRSKKNRRTRRDKRR